MAFPDLNDRRLDKEEDLQNNFADTGITSNQTNITPSAAYQYATGEGGIGLEAMNQNIRNFFNNIPTQEAAQAAMAEYGVSDEDIKRATGKSFKDYFPTISSGNQTAVSGGTGDVSLGTSSISGATGNDLVTIAGSRDLAQQNIIDAATVRPIGGSAAYQYAMAPGGIGIEQFNQNIRNFLANNPSELESFNAMKQYGISKEDVERATGKAYTDTYPEVFKPGNVLTSGFGNVTQQLSGSDYYKGVKIPTFYGDSSGETFRSAADQLADWKAGIDRADLTANAPFGFTSNITASGETIGNRPSTAIDYLRNNNPQLADAIGSHTSTFARTYKIINGELKEVSDDQITPEDIASGNAFFFFGGKTGGPSRERMAQLYRADGNDLVPIGEPQIYKGASETDPGLKLFDFAASMLAMVPGPWQLPANIYLATRGALEGDPSALIRIIAPPIVS